MSEPIKVRTTPALLSPFVSIGREFRVLFTNPTALLGGIFGSGAFIAGAVAFALFGPKFEANAAEDDDDELEMEFMPGELMRKGEQMDPEDIPEKIIVEETVAAEVKEEAKVTTDEKAQPNPEPKKNDKPKEDIKATEKPDPNKGKDVKVSDKNRDSNTPYKDLPTVKDLPGNPFGDANGWSDMAKDGDPWATAVMGALNGMKVGAYAGQGTPASYQFQLVICADGSIDDVRVKKPSGDGQLDGAIKNALESLKLPKAPADIAKQLAGKCKKIPYVFTWSGKGQSGKIK
jgi:outer membrane biosynthesis protein TonB